MMHMPHIWWYIAGYVVSLLVVSFIFWRIGQMATIGFTVNITINPAGPPPLSAVSNPLNLTGTVGSPFTADLSQNVTGGKPPVTLSISGTLPDGLTANGSVISGTPTTAGTTSLSVTATDSGS